MKSNRNKTIDFSLNEGKEFLSKCVDGKLVEKIEQNQVVVGDFFDAIDKVKNKSVDLLIVDPPYNLYKDFDGNGFKKTDLNSYATYTESWIKKVKPKLKENASVYVCCDWQSSIVIGGIISSHFILRNRITWQREKGRGAKENWKNSMEDIFFATVSDKYTFNLDAVKIRRKVLAPYVENGIPRDWEEVDGKKYRYTCPSNFWDDISVPYWSMPENTAHPTQKPEKLIAKIILASSNKGDLVLDPFGGSGTSGVTAKKLGRKYILIEQNPLYCAWAQKRLCDADENKEIQGYYDGVFWEKNTFGDIKKEKNKQKDKIK